jgi:peptidoglycan-associated lipoprotein
MRTNQVTLLPIAVLVAVGLGGCKGRETSSPDSSTRFQSRSTVKTVEPTTEDRTPERAVLTIIGVDIDTRLAMMCGIPDSKVFFEYDSAELTADAKALLQEVATCVINGPAKGKELRVIGRTDPRGTDEYNDTLGMSRSQSVADHLQSLGVEGARVETESKGEAAAGPDPYGWPYDRRVTIRLQD